MNRMRNGNTAKDLMEEQEKRAEDELNKIKEIGKSKVGKIWEIKKKVVGGKKATMEATAIVNPETGKMVVGIDDIKKVTLKYCKETLGKNEPENEFKDDIYMKENIMKEKLKDDGKTMFEVSKETFDKVILKFKNSNKRNYDFIVKASQEFKNHVFKMCTEMIKQEKFPNNFNETILHMIYKGKGKCEELSNNRFIHSKSWLPRLVEALVRNHWLMSPQYTRLEASLATDQKSAVCNEKYCCKTDKRQKANAVANVGHIKVF